MPRNKQQKRAVRARMEKTGESYTSARAALVDEPTRRIVVEEPPAELLAAARRRVLQPSDEARPAIERACQRLCSVPGVRGVFLWNLAGELVHGAGDAALGEQVRARTIEDQAFAEAVDLLIPLAPGARRLVALRRISLRPSPFFMTSRGLQMDWHRLVVVREAGMRLTAVIDAGGESLEVVRLRLGHAALAIERALRDG